MFFRTREKAVEVVNYSGVFTVSGATILFSFHKAKKKQGEDTGLRNNRGQDSRRGGRG